VSAFVVAADALIPPSAHSSAVDNLNIIFAHAYMEATNAHFLLNPRKGTVSH
jgi:hypothetical protein